MDYADVVFVILLIVFRPDVTLKPLRAIWAHMNLLHYTIVVFVITVFWPDIALKIALAIWAVCDFIQEIVVTWWHYQPRPPAPFANPWPFWEVVAEFQPSSDERLGYVVHCDSNPIDDPLHPHVSFVYVVGLQTRNRFLCTFTIWRVSLLTGERMYVCYFTVDLDPRPFVQSEVLKVCSFHSRGVIFIYARVFKRIGDHSLFSGRLFVFDVRHKTLAEEGIDQHLIGRHTIPLAILCLGRRMKGKSIEGWRIRFVGPGITPNNALGHRIVFVNVLADVSASNSESIEVLTISREDVFPYAPTVGIRSAGKVGIHQQHRAFVYDLGTDRFRLFDNMAELYESDKVLNEYADRIPEGQRARIPAVMTDREVVLKVKGKPVFIRTSFQPLTLRLLAAQALFKANPTLAKSTNADQFLQATGVDLWGISVEAGCIDQ